jgi:hypothetical protein
MGRSCRSSAGPAECPERNLVLLTTSSLLAAYWSGTGCARPTSGRWWPTSPMPGTRSPFRLRYEVARDA